MRWKIHWFYSPFFRFNQLNLFLGFDDEIRNIRWMFTNIQVCYEICMILFIVMHEINMKYVTHCKHSICLPTTHRPMYEYMWNRVHQFSHVRVTNVARRHRALLSKQRTRLDSLTLKNLELNAMHLDDCMYELHI